MGSLLLAMAAVSAAGAPAFSSADFSQAEYNVQGEFRSFRVQVYDTYRAWRPQYDHRRAVGEQMFQAWKQAGGQPHQATPLVQWYIDAKTASLPTVNQPLPPPPAFPLAIQMPASGPELTGGPRRLSPAERSSRRRYEVRRLDATEVVVRQPAPRVNPDEPAKPVWQSVSRALYNGMMYGVSRATPEH